ncbi:hypothetical protein RFH95_12405 [Acinetobacter nosocomialis]|uniref:DUF7709 family protein n=1 Tax=Acinetobacter nosocomialis TaxID=106654 RepID=UPI000B3DE918|nr:hypothetical protein [Acinetobacter nosocomialis]MBD0443138.1 hypothetical protein [Acinetobacter nosocomialis]MDE9416344.1 hypothetical protein [Acinetobacter nosocomialis]MDQ9041227.1 hypothetical protein [Acinetobacter nosocomialis]MDR9533568.1 hypothetical protein [Acinetobacter nosocomialis]OUT26632.1 hypothetical protein H125_10080 [Acinetobacter nosocomialis P020]
MTKVVGLDQLSVINQKVVSDGEVLPQVVLKDGSQVQTGTVATMLHNIELYNAGQRGQIEEELKIAIPTLIKVGLFDLFEVDEWVSGRNAGRTFVGMHAKAYLQQKEQENN